MLFGNWQNLAKSPNFSIQLYGKTLERVAKFGYLGVVLDENLSWKDHVEYVGSKVSRRLGLLPPIRSCLTLEASKQVHSCSHYLTMLMLRGAKSQRGVAKSYTAHRTVQLELHYGRTPLNDAFCGLNWLNVASRRKMHKCILVFQCLHNLVPSILRNISQGMRICTIMQLGEATTCTHQSLNVTWAKELLSMQGLFISILYPILLKVPRL